MMIRKTSAFSAVSLLSLALLLPACTADTGPPTAMAEDKASIAPVTSPAESTENQPVKGKAFLMHKVSEALDFTYGYPAEAAAIPALGSHFDAAAEKILNESLEQANVDMDNSKASGFPIRQHSFSKIWQRVAQTPQVLSLSSDIETYTGGAHGMVAFDSLLWDRQKNTAIEPMSLFISKAAFDAAVAEPLCAGIAAAKKAKGIEPDMSPDSVFERCPKPSEQVLWLGSSDGKSLDRMTIGITAYIVGPYAEGNYRINLPLNAAAVRAVKPEYAAFVRAKG